MKYAVIGAGWAGCSAAVGLAQHGHQVHLFEAARTLGGRARQVNSNGLTLDNGQHIMLGAYQSTLKLLRTIDVDHQQALLRLPLQLCYPINSGGIELITARLPAPFHILTALLTTKGISRADKMCLARFFTTARWMDWQLNRDCSVSELLQRHDQTDHAIRLLWQPLCTAALNTPIQRASAQIFLNVLKDSFGARRAASDILIARTDLTGLLPQPAATFIEHHGGKVYLGCTVQTLIKKEQRWQLRFQQTVPDDPGHFDGVVIATPPEVASNLLAPFTITLPSFDYEPITTCYLKYPASIKLPRPFFALVEHPEQKAWGQFVFDRGQLETPGHTGLLAVVISASQFAIEQGRHSLAIDCAKQLATVFKRPELATPEWAQVITEKRATFSCVPDLIRPSHQLPISGLVLAGDYTENRYPATLESAVQSGLLAATYLQKKGDLET